MAQLPCDCDGLCMVCKAKPIDEEKLTCKTCASQWHVTCLARPPERMADTLHWECPDCSDFSAVNVGEGAVNTNGSGELVAAIRAIEADESLNDEAKAKKRQRLLSGKAVNDYEDKGSGDCEKKKDVLEILSGTLNCSFCMQLPERPVTTPCGHNFCLKCFQKWIAQGKLTCAKCRSAIPSKMASQPRINSALVIAIRMAKVSKNIGAGETSRVYHVLHNQDRPDKAYTTERAQKSGKANACSGKIFVTVPQDHFGPIPAENDPVRNQGVLVGECWEDRLECRQWGVHFPHVSGIAGQSDYGAQSVVLSGGYIDDEDHGEYFLYTGSGGRDLSGNKRTSNTQSFDQTFEKYNKALKLSCLKGYPVRVVRSHKEKRSAYAPEKGLRYDGVYRIEKCWRKQGLQGFKVCRYLFVRVDNEPAPWTSDDRGDLPRDLPVIPELAQATDLVERNVKQKPSWDFDEKESCWKWKIPPPRSNKPVKSMDPNEVKRSRKEIRKARNVSIREKLLKGFGCLICKEVMAAPVTTPCAHNFCKSCLENAFAGKSFVKERSRGGRSLRTQKNVMKCPSCPTDISEFLQNIQVNTELLGLIESLKTEAEEKGEGSEDGDGDGDGDGAEGDSGDAGATMVEDKDTSVEKLSDSAEESDVSKLEPKISKGNCKRKRDDSTNVSPKAGKTKKVEEDDGNDSPASPLHLSADH